VADSVIFFDGFAFVEDKDVVSETDVQEIVGEFD